MFKQIPTIKSKPLSQDKKHQKLLTKIDGGWYMEKITKGIPPLRKQKLSKKSQERDDKIQKKLYTDNRSCNDWKYQLH